MEKLKFPWKELLRGLVISPHEDEGTLVVKLNNNHALIGAKIYDKKEISLDYFKNNSETKGTARCALFILLNGLLVHSPPLVSPETLVSVRPLGEARGEKGKRLIKIYEEIGFTQSDPELGSPVILRASVQKLIETLSRQCDMTGGGKYIKTKSNKRKSNKHKTKRGYHKKKYNLKISQKRKSKKRKRKTKRKK